MNLVGKLLVATQKMPDRLFKRSVICILAHSEEGATGVILNKNTSQTVKDFWASGLENYAGTVNTLKYTNEYVQLGGPVHGPVLVLHNLESSADVKVADGVWCSAKIHTLQQVVQDSEKFRFYHGYSGWISNQLENEIKSGHWHVADPCNLGDLVFHEQFSEQKIWRKAIGLVGLKVFQTIGIEIEEFNHNCSYN